MLQNEDAHHDFGWVWGPPAFARILARKQLVDEAGQVGKVDVMADDFKRIAQRLQLALARLIGKQVELDGAAGGRGGHRGAINVEVQGATVEGWGFLEVPY